MFKIVLRTSNITAAESFQRGCTSLQGYFLRVTFDYRIQLDTPAQDVGLVVAAATKVTESLERTQVDIRSAMRRYIVHPSQFGWRMR